MKERTLMHAIIQALGKAFLSLYLSLAGIDLHLRVVRKINLLDLQRGRYYTC